MFPLFAAHAQFAHCRYTNFTSMIGGDINCGKVVTRLFAPVMRSYSELEVDWCKRNTNLLLAPKPHASFNEREAQLFRRHTISREHC